MNTYAEQAKYFDDNRRKALARYDSIHQAYVARYDRVLGYRSGKEKRHAVALVLLLRAAVYTNTAHDMALTGHLDEARILLRSPVELALLALLILRSDETWSLWVECHGLRMKHTDEDGIVKTEDLKEKRFEVAEMIKQFGETCADEPVFAELKRYRGEISTYYSHENLYNIVTRVDHEETRTTLYIGQGAESRNDRAERFLRQTIFLMEQIDEVCRKIPPRE
jgi:hypothetical protein